MSHRFLSMNLTETRFDATPFLFEVRAESYEPRQQVVIPGPDDSPVPVLVAPARD